MRIQQNTFAAIFVVIPNEVRNLYPIEDAWVEEEFWAQKTRGLSRDASLRSERHTHCYNADPMRRSPAVFFVYILSSLSGTLYVGVSNNIQRRAAEHWIGQSGSFTSRYRVNRLVYFETYTDVVKAIAREKQIKSWRREKKIALIKSMNPSWRDLRKGLLETSVL